MQPHRDCCSGLCNAAEPEINCRKDLFSEHFAVYSQVPTYFYLKPIFPSLFLRISHFRALAHLSSVILALPLTAPLSCCSKLPLPLYSFSHFPLLFLLFSFFPSHYASPSSYIYSIFSMSLCLHLCFPHYILILSLFSAPHFPLRSADLLYLCSLAVLSVGCSYLNLTPFLRVELLSKHYREEGAGEQS